MYRQCGYWCRQMSPTFQDVFQDSYFSKPFWIKMYKLCRLIVITFNFHRNVICLPFLVNSGWKAGRFVVNLPSLAVILFVLIVSNEIYTIVTWGGEKGEIKFKKIVKFERKTIWSFANVFHRMLLISWMELFKGCDEIRRFKRNGNRWKWNSFGK